VSLRQSAPDGLKDAGRDAVRWLSQPTAGLRLEPDLLIVGASRCGTTSLHRALLTHPGTVPPILRKGVHYFDVAYGRGRTWYRSHFPLRATAVRRTAGVRGGPVCFESSGYYMFHPQAPERLARDLPGVRLVVMLRDPVERAFSAFKHEHARGFEHVDSFEEALDLEAERLEGEVEKITADPAYISLAHRHQAYVARGHYADQLRVLVDLVGSERVHILFSEDFFATPEAEYERLLAFLGLPVVHAPAYEQHNARRGRAMDPATRERLRSHFEPYDAELATLVGRVPPWRR
jgi:hypothetical protein